METSNSEVDWTELPIDLLERRIWHMLPFESVLATGLTCSTWYSALINLYHLNISYRAKRSGPTISETQLQPFIAQFQNLYSVTLTGAPNLTWPHIDAIAQASGSTLSSLALNLSSGTQLNGNTWRLAESFPQLRHLDIKGCVVPISACTPSVFPPALTSLRLSSCLKVVDESLVQLASFLKGLKRFEARGVYRLTDVGMTALLKANPGLTSIDLSSLMNLTNATILCATQHCPNMKTFIARATNFCGDALSAIGPAWGGSLTHLALKMCLKLTERDICEKLLPGLHALQILDIQKAPLSESSPILRAIVDNCPKLQSLDLRDCTEWKANGGDWAEFLASCPSMTSLYVRSPLFLDDHLREIANSAPKMVSLYLQECTSLTHVGIQYVTDAVLSGKLRCLYRLTITDIPFNHEIVQSLTLKCPSVLTTHLKEPKSSESNEDNS